MCKAVVDGVNVVQTNTGFGFSGIFTLSVDVSRIYSFNIEIRCYGWGNFAWDLTRYTSTLFPLEVVASPDCRNWIKFEFSNKWVERTTPATVIGNTRAIYSDPDSEPW